MCGIAGIYDLAGRFGREQLQQLATAMASRLRHRGPDDQGIWLSGDGRCVLAHRRLSVLDVSTAGHQPMVSDDGRHVICYNGELYNFRELRTAAEARGQQFHSHCDTEVWLDGLSHEGSHFLTRADGMFALAFYDNQSGELLLARDPFGEKPLYYALIDGALAFASELSALQLLPGFDATISADQLALYLAFQQAPEPATIYRQVRKLEPGQAMRVGRQGAAEPFRYCHFDCHDSGQSRSLDDAADELEALLTSSIQRRLVADVPLGCFLSGGVDSSTVVALITQRLGLPIQTFSIGFAGVAESEHEDAAAIARHLGAQHTSRVIAPAAYLELIDTIAAMDEPNADTSCIPTYLVSALAREQVTVAVTGDGADELFGGYSRYAQCLAAAAGREQQMASRQWHLGRDYYSGRVLVYQEAELRSLFGRVPGALVDKLLAARRFIDLSAAPPLHRLRLSDIRNYLPLVLAKVDRMSMQHALECRTPFLSPDIAAFAARLPAQLLLQDGVAKAVLRRLAARYLPAEWIYRPKRGFSIDPLNAELRQAVSGRLLHRLQRGESRLSALFPADPLRAFVAAELPGLGFYHGWALLLLDLWLERNPWRRAEEGL